MDQALISFALQPGVLELQGVLIQLHYVKGNTYVLLVPHGPNVISYYVKCYLFFLFFLISKFQEITFVWSITGNTYGNYCG